MRLESHDKDNTKVYAFLGPKLFFSISIRFAIYLYSCSFFQFPNRALDPRIFFSKKNLCSNAINRIQHQKKKEQKKMKSKKGTQKSTKEKGRI